MNTAYDYIIVGAGSAGCVLADRLTADGRNKVLVLEFGGSDRSVFVQMPSALSIPMNSPKFDWGYRSEPEANLGGRRMHTPRGKVIGGSSSINGMVYVRGNPMDFEGWAQQGARGWDYAHVLPYFMRAETRRDGATPYRGGSGPLNTQYGRLKNPLYQAFVDAAHQAGYPVTDDINGGQQEGFGLMDMTVHKGRRWSAANAYLKPALSRPNLDLVTHAMVERILFDGKEISWSELNARLRAIPGLPIQPVIVFRPAIGAECRQIVRVRAIMNDSLECRTNACAEGAEWDGQQSHGPNI